MAIKSTINNYLQSNNSNRDRKNQGRNINRNITDKELQFLVTFLSLNGCFAKSIDELSYDRIDIDRLTKDGVYTIQDVEEYVSALEGIIGIDNENPYLYYVDKAFIDYLMKNDTRLANKNFEDWIAFIEPTNDNHATITVLHNVKDDTVYFETTKHDSDRYPTVEPKADIDEALETKVFNNSPFLRMVNQLEQGEAVINFTKENADSNYTNVWSYDGSKFKKLGDKRHYITDDILIYGLSSMSAISTVLAFMRGDIQIINVGDVFIKQFETLLGLKLQINCPNNTDTYNGYASLGDLEINISKRFSHNKEIITANEFKTALKQLSYQLGNSDEILTIDEDDYDMIFYSEFSNNEY